MLEKQIDSSEQARKQSEFLDLKNQSLESKIEKFEFLVRERDSYLSMYKNSQRKVNDLESGSENLEEDLRVWCLGSIPGVRIRTGEWEASQPIKMGV